MAEHPGTVSVEVVFQFGANEIPCLDVVQQIVDEHVLLGPPVRDNAAGTVTSTFTLDVMVDPDGVDSKYRVVHPEEPA